MAVGDCEREFASSAARDGVVLSRYRLPAINQRGHFGLPSEAESAIVALQSIFRDLGGRSGEQSSKRLTALPGDFLHEPSATIIEIDEFQHFTSHRRISFDRYPAGASLNYDFLHYRDLCDELSPKADAYRRTKNAVGFGAGGRQRQRAYNDALRDLVLPLVGYQPIIRIPAVHGDGARAYQENRERIRSALDS